MNQFLRSIAVVANSTCAVHVTKRQLLVALSAQREAGATRKASIDPSFFVTHYQPVFNAIALKLSIHTPQDWYLHSNTALESTEVQAAARVAGGLGPALRAIYPDVEFHDWKLGKLPRNFWHSKSNRRRFFESIVPAARLEGWYSEKFLTTEVSKLRHAPSVLKIFRGSLVNALKDAFPEHNWQEWRFVRGPHGIWKEKAQRKRFFDAFAEHHQIGKNDVDSWYTITQRQVADFGGASMLRLCYQNSISRAVMDIYPDKNFKIWKFLNPHREWWTLPGVALEFASAFSAHKNLITLEDWYSVQAKEIEQFGSGQLRVQELLAIAYPNHVWEEALFKRKTRQRTMFG